MSVTSSLPLPFGDADASADARIDGRDQAGRQRAVDPAFNVALQASAGTGKTHVLVDRYVNLLRAGVDPANILAMTFTRKAAAEMRDRIISSLRAVAARGEIPPARWRELRDRTGEIAISTIDAFCLSLLREFPLEADVDPGFRMADDTEGPRLVDEALDRALRICRSLARDDEHVALVFAQLGERRVHRGLAALLGRRIVAPDLLDRYLASGPRDLSVAVAAQRTVDALHDVLKAMPGGMEGFLDSGPLVPAFTMLKRQLTQSSPSPTSSPASPCPLPPAPSLLFARVREHFLTQDDQPRKKPAYRKAEFASERDWRRHRDAVVANAPAVARVLARHRHDLNIVVSHGVRRMFQVALTEYRRTLDAHAVLDFPDVLLRALDLLRQMDEFAQSRFRLEARYHHILVDEFQDTSHAQWELVSLLIRSWGEGAGIAHAGPLQPSIFIVGDPKQSIYGFRDADVSILQDAGRFLEGLRPDGDVRRAISRSFRAVPELLAFINDLFGEIDKTTRRDAFRYDEEDRFPTGTTAAGEAAPGDGGVPSAPERPVRSGVLGLIAGDSAEACAARAASEIERLLREGTVRDRETGIARPATPGDVAILFRTRDSHREFEAALESRSISAYVYKGLGFFDADEIKDVLALLWYLADPQSDLRAAAWLRSRLVGISDEGLRLLAPRLADAVLSRGTPDAFARLDEHDARLLDQARTGAAAWLALVDRLPPAELLDRVLNESSYAVELRGLRLPQARENLKKIRALVRRIQNRGYLTLARVAEYIDRLSIGDESNAVVDALDAVNLMTVHAAKGLEFPIVFVVNLTRGTGNWRDPIRISADGDADAPVSVAVGDFLSDADEVRPAKEREETKRLLYVALTRARDFLYLAAVVKDGTLQPGRGSLAEVLPPGLVALFAGAFANSGSPTAWHPASHGNQEGEHRFHVCSNDQPDGGRPSPPPTVYVDDLTPILEAAPAYRRRVAGQAAPSQVPAAIADPADRTGMGSDRLVGSLVHRLLERVGIGRLVGGLAEDQIDAERVRALLPDLLRPDEQAQAVALDRLSERVARAFGAVCARADVRAIVGSGMAFHEVPFTVRVDDVLVRGTIDLLVRSGDGRVTVLEFKTGARRPEDLEQLALYEQAAARLFPGAPVDARLVYSHDAGD